MQAVNKRPVIAILVSNPQCLAASVCCFGDEFGSNQNAAGRPVRLQTDQVIERRRGPKERLGPTWHRPVAELVLPSGHAQCVISKIIPHRAPSVVARGAVHGVVRCQHDDGGHCPMQPLPRRSRLLAHAIILASGWLLLPHGRVGFVVQASRLHVQPRRPHHKHVRPLMAAPQTRRLSQNRGR